MRILSGRTPVRTSGRNPCAIRLYVYTVKNPLRTFRLGDYVKLELARKMGAKISNAGFTELILLSRWTTTCCCCIQSLILASVVGKKNGHRRVIYKPAVPVPDL